MGDNMKIKRGDITRVRGVTYRSVSEAARQIGVNYATLAAALDRGTQDNCGLHGPIAGRLDGVLYPSKRAAARALGISEMNLYHRIKRGKVTWEPVDADYDSK